MRVVRRWVSGNQAGHERREIHVLSDGTRWLVRWVGGAGRRGGATDDEDAAYRVVGPWMVGRVWTEAPAGEVR